MKPLPSIYFPHFIAANQQERANNTLKNMTHNQLLAKLRSDIKNFRQVNNVEKVIVLWTATTERFCDENGFNTPEEVFQAMERNDREISPSTIFACASILENCSFINGSPQNTLVSGVVELARRQNVFVAGDDFKTGQTKLKSVMADFLIGTGIKLRSCVSYNHLGNNDGKNLSAPAQFRSKEISKSSVLDDIVSNNGILYKDNEKPDHCVVIKYVPTVGDSKRALDEYESEIFLSGRQTISIFNICEDSLLAVPVMIDLVVLTELFSRVKYQYIEDKKKQIFENFDPVLSILSCMLKSPRVPKHTPVINALYRQRLCIENIVRALIGLPPTDNMFLEFKTGFNY
jgi:myo-inositol-1-phosphate synthase